MSFRGNHGRGKWKPNSIAFCFLLAHHLSEQKIFAWTIATMIPKSLPFNRRAPSRPIQTQETAWKNKGCVFRTNQDTEKSQKTRDSRLSSFVLSLSDPLRLTRNYGRSLVRFTILVVCSLAVSLATLVVRFATLVARSEVSRLPSFAHSFHKTRRSISNSRRSICYSVYHFNRVKVHTPLQTNSWTH